MENFAPITASAEPFSLLQLQNKYL